MCWSHLIMLLNVFLFLHVYNFNDFYIYGNSYLENIYVYITQRTASYVTETAFFLDRQIWNLLPIEYKNI